MTREMQTRLEMYMHQRYGIHANTINAPRTPATRVPAETLGFWQVGSDVFFGVRKPLIPREATHDKPKLS